MLHLASNIPLHGEQTGRRLDVPDRAGTCESALMHHFISGGYLLCIVSVAMLYGCTTVSNHGDAELHDRPDFPFTTSDSLYLPAFSLADAGAVYRWRIRDLPYGVFPREVIVYAQSEDKPGSAPWQTVLLNIQIFSTDGSQLIEREVDFSIWNGGASVVDSGWEVRFPLEQLPAPEAMNYDVVVTVLRASTRLGDQARLHGLTKIGWMK